MNDPTEPLRDAPAEEDWPYTERVTLPLAQGYGIACFFAVDEDDEAQIVTAFYNADKAKAMSPDPRTRVRSAILEQNSARAVMAITHGLEPFVD